MLVYRSFRWGAATRLKTDWSFEPYLGFDVGIDSFHAALLIAGNQVLSVWDLGLIGRKGFAAFDVLQYFGGHLVEVMECCSVLLVTPPYMLEVLYIYRTNCLHFRNHGCAAIVAPSQWAGR